MLVLIVIYSALAFHNLGNTVSPQTAWSGDTAVIIDLGEVRYISRFQFMTGARYVPFMLYASECGEDWAFALRIDEPRVFAWAERQVDFYAKYLQVIPFNADFRIQEIAFRGRDDALIVPFHIFTDGAHVLFDEQRLVPYSRSFMNSTYFDEIYHARTGYEFLHGLTVFETTHPPMGKNFIAMGISAFGMTPFGWRFPGVVAGILMIPLMYAFGRLMFDSAWWGLFAAFIFAFDFMPFVQTRIATIDSYVTLFVLASYLCMFVYVKKYSLLALAASGLFIGLAVASKWQGLYALAGLPFLFFPAWRRVLREEPRRAWVTFAACFGFFIAVPVAVYLLSYIPFVRAMDAGDGFLATVAANQRLMFGYHSGLLEGHPFASRWWEWPIIVRPVFYYVNDGQGISSFGNPAVWWMGIAAAVFAVTKIRERDEIAVFLLIAYAAQFLPWAFISRATFIYHYFPSVPFVVLLVAYFARSWRRQLVPVYAALVFGLFVLFYPVLSATPVSVEFAHRFLRWFPAWILL